MQATSSLQDSSNIQKIEANELFSLPNFASHVSSKLQDEGYLIISNLKLPSRCRDQALESLVRLIGEPVLHSPSDKSFILDIKKKVGTTSAVPTYSEHNDEAFLHTDSAYKEVPEDAFVLYCIKPASCQGGVSTLLSLSDIYDEMALHPRSNSLIRELESVKYPYLVPSIFKLERDKVNEFVHAPILESSQNLRFRRDILQKGLAKSDTKLDEKAIYAFEWFKSLIENSQKVININLAAGDLLLINNKITLHGRTAFSDSSRHLLRIRFNFKESVATPSLGDSYSVPESTFLNKFVHEV